MATSEQKLFRVDLKDPNRIEVIRPFDKKMGSIFSPPAFDPRKKIALAFDTGNGLLAGVRYSLAKGLEKIWHKPIRISMQMILYSDTSEIVVNDFKTGFDNLVVLDIETGKEKGRVATQSPTANGMFLSPGWSRDFYYCSIGTVARGFI
jgi:hypothetical protein